ncbi:thiol:disulfide interchange protein DsbA/DsbL [Allochromatium vinosum]|uniref:Thiol:disulfide interchange protein n=1 Tax=Allochromatium vinosum (strain ATCC 17899 / DSM 180 / NBRC 103801 / NCIMB 10441 / D) TaxID=572477 RepID=D3RP94_ALLVD|nr:thiol:disulfide interchange protein DsbA/DsbL [Allochromatium vinosum]ADC63484.1 DSBA oxidoreductase [Allochromatium vinosum DSM 180]
MPLTRRHFNRLIFGSFALAALPPVAARAALVEGEDWRAITPPQPTDVPGKIEVLEFFSYGCPHCGSLNPLLKQWKSTLPEDVVLRRVPITFGRQAWANLACLFYALESLEALDRLDQAVFTALHEQRVKLYTEPAILEWLGDKEIDIQSFKDAFNSFDVQTKVGRSDYLAERYQIDAVPTLAVAGRYAVLGHKAQGMPDLLAIADQLIDRARNEGAAG